MQKILSDIADDTGKLMEDGEWEQCQRMEALMTQQGQRFEELIQRFERVESKLAEQPERAPPKALSRPAPVSRSLARSAVTRSAATIEQRYARGEIRQMASDLIAQMKAAGRSADFVAQSLMFARLPMNVKTKLQKKIIQQPLRSVDHLHQLLIEAMYEEMC